MAAAHRLPLAFLRLLRPARCMCTSTTAAPSAEELYDLVIAGGGVVGAALASSLGSEPSLSHKKVLLLEPSLTSPRTVAREDAYSNRISALSLGSVDLLKRLGAWEQIEEMRATPFTRMHVWDACSDARMVFDNQSPCSADDYTIHGTGLHGEETPVPDDMSALGYVVEDRVVMAALSGVLEREGQGVELARDSRIKEIKPQAQDGPWVEVVMEDGTSVNTRLLVGADGTNSRVRRLGGFQHVGWSYDQSALVATVHLHEVTNNATIWQRFLPSGPISLLPLTNSIGSLLWSTTPDHAQTLLEMSEERFVDAVNAAFWDPLPQDEIVTAVSQAIRDTISIFSSEPPPPHQLPPTVSAIDSDNRAAFPLALGHTPCYVKPRMALVGDAAHRVHPLAGLGINLGLGDVVSLTTSLVAANSRGADWGSLGHLLEYETARLCHNVPTMAAINGLHHLFSTSWVPAVLARSLGFHVVNAFPPLKELIQETAENAA